jgi:hypothetical protein
MLGLLNLYFMNSAEPMEMDTLPNEQPPKDEQPVALSYEITAEAVKEFGTDNSESSVHDTSLVDISMASIDNLEINVAEAEGAAPNTLHAVEPTGLPESVDSQEDTSMLQGGKGIPLNQDGTKDVHTFVETVQSLDVDTIDPTVAQDVKGSEDSQAGDSVGDGGPVAPPDELSQVTTELYEVTSVASSDHDHAADSTSVIEIDQFDGERVHGEVEEVMTEVRTAP